MIQHTWYNIISCIRIITILPKSPLKKYKFLNKGLKCHQINNKPKIFYKNQIKRNDFNIIYFIVLNI